MSWQATAWAARQTAGGPGAKCLLLLLANTAGKEGACFPGRKSLAEDAECRPETITANLAKLEAAGLIARFQRRRKDGSRTTDWIVLAPNHDDRGEMADAEAEEFPGVIARAARRGSPEVSSPEVSGAAQVGFPGRHEPVSEPSTPSARSGARASTRGIKVNGKPVDLAVWSRTIEALDHFNAITGKSLGALTGAGQPSENAKRIYLRLVAWPDLDIIRIRDIIDRTLISKWWGDGEPSVGVIFGPKVFEDNMTRQPSQKQARSSAKKERAAEDLAAIGRLIGGQA